MASQASYRVSEKDRARFADKHVLNQENGCWEWNACTSKWGYGKFWLARLMGAHRASYLMNIGDIPQGKCVLHRCDNRRCVNPEHLFVGTKKDNTQDMLAKGRCPPRKGENGPKSILKAADIPAIRADPRSNAEIGKAYGVRGRTIQAIKSGENWSHIPMGEVVKVKPGGARLSDEDVLAIRADGRTTKVIARQYGVHHAYVSQIKLGKRRKHIGA